MIDFTRPAEHFTRGFEFWECPQDPAYTVGETVTFTVEPDTESNPNDYDTYDAERIEAWLRQDWRYVTLAVTVLGGLFGERSVGHASIGSVESDSSAEHYAELLESLYADAMYGGTDEHGRPLCGPNLDTHRPEWTVGMLIIDDEDVESLARERRSVGLPPPVCATCDRTYPLTD